MGEMINKEFEKFQQELHNKDKKIKFITSFEITKDIDNVLSELKKKEVTL